MHKRMYRCILMNLYARDGENSLVEKFANIQPVKSVMWHKLCIILQVYLDQTVTFWNMQIIRLQLMLKQSATANRPEN